ncbi:MAG: diguanylate cyclase [Sphingomonas sp.]|nr:diguanylate cyclase [Sphingomonas sp.]RZV51827.1 MAG: diguanylate cyclase [Sphingomonadaceae bacterium]
MFLNRPSDLLDEAAYAFAIYLIAILTMDAASLFFALIPAMFASFGLALAIIAVIEPGHKVARWASVAFLLSAVAIALDVFRPVEDTGLGYLAIVLHFLILIMLLQAFLSRHRLAMKPPAFIAALIGMISLFPNAPWWPDFTVRPIIVHLVGFIIIACGLRCLWATRKDQLIDRLVIGLLMVSAASYLARAALPLVLPITPDTVADGQLTQPYVVFSHMIGAMAGLASGFLLMIAIGLDVLRWRGEESRTDYLTGLGNRRNLQRAIDGHAAGLRQISDVIAIDLDHFKSVNDRFGHAAGDALLREVGRILRKDFAKYGDICRIGGEEFVLLILPGRAPNPIKVAQSIVASIRAIRLDELPAAVVPTASVGHAAHVDGENLEATLRLADAAVYRAKDNGRDRVETVHPEDILPIDIGSQSRKAAAD